MCLRVLLPAVGRSRNTYQDRCTVDVSNLKLLFVSSRGQAFTQKEVVVFGTGRSWRRMGPTTVVRIVASAVLCVALGVFTVPARADGSARAWGMNQRGQLGDGTTADRSTPCLVTDSADVVAVSAGDSFSMMLRTNGTVWAWG